MSQPIYGTLNDGGSSTEPLLPKSHPNNLPQVQSALAAQSSASRNSWMDTPNDDIPDDFKVGVVVYDCDDVIRRAFVRKVYAILLCQLVLTAAVGVILSFDGPRMWVQQNTWMVWVSMLGTFASLFGVYAKRHDFPANMILLTMFTLFEGALVGTVTSFYDARIVVQALIISAGVFIGLTLFTFQTKFDFSSFGPFLSAGLWGLIAVGLIGMFFPFGSTFELIVSCGGVLIFAGLVMYDTQQIMKRLSPDEAVLASLTLYLDFLNLFLYILRALNSQDRD